MPSYAMLSFKDGHCHPLFAAREALKLDVSDCETLIELRKKIADFATANPQLEWIDCGTFKPQLAEGSTARDLDGICSQAVVIHSHDHHSIWVNTEALRRSGLEQIAPDLPVGDIALDAGGRPNGRFFEWSAMNLVLQHIPALSLEQELDALEATQQRLLSLGITAMQDAWIDPGMTEIYVEFAKRSRLKMRVNLALRFDPNTWRKDLQYFEQCLNAARELNYPKLHINGAKFLFDGTLTNGTAYLSEPYAKSSDRGALLWSADELSAAIKASLDLGLAPHIHAIGDAAVRAALDVLEPHAKQFESLASRPVIAHCDLIADEDLHRFAQLGIVANLQPIWARRDELMNHCLANIGTQRESHLYRIKSLIDMGALVSFGSDWPVSDPNPLAGIYTATYRSVDGKQALNPSEAVTLQQALAAYTTGVEAQFNRNNKADDFDRDYIVLSENPHELSREEFARVRVIETYIDGELVWSESVVGSTGLEPVTDGL